MRLSKFSARIRGPIAAAAIALGALLPSALVSAPAATAAEPAGTVISVEAQPDGWHGMTGGAVVDYWTTTSSGTPVRASGAVFLPAGQPPAGGWPVAAYDHGTTGLGMGCSGITNPVGAPYPGSRGKEDRILEYFQSKGFAVVAPDYLGLGRFDTGPHPYLERQTEATATIDLLRAARATYPQLSRTWIAVGASQGGQAALGTGHLQQTYASDLDFRGTIALDPESDLEHVLPVAGPWVPSIPEIGDGSTAFIAGVLVGLRETRPDIDVDSYLSPRGRELLDSIGALCLDKMIDQVAGSSLGALLAKPLGDPRFTAALTDYLAVPTSGYDAPILLLLNATDKTVPSPLHAALAAQLAANGVDARSVVGFGQHCELNPQMWAAMDEFVARVRSTPTEP
ncbi:alpha/beta fold hydrolase [Nocardia veterana]|uniref:Alpha/beta fold hydrolase n=1 Tax=Nocardia veterana TaxID=132249 RepID=A0A7X6RJX7_9NOCA|nr:alpha/beta fold hydrolase [Nocardia veterana]NKY88670.1 alpha/beta fold hydrolase [Nocardia veterana]